MNYASKDLIDEHKGILFGLKILEKMIKPLPADASKDLQDFRDIVGFFKLFADQCHHGKEEGLLFPAMEQAGIPRQNGPIGQMLIEHVEGRKYIAQMNAAFTDNSLKDKDFFPAATNYINLLRLHIEKEDSILFPLGDQKIPQAKQEELLAAFEEFEEKVMGKGTHEKLHKLLHYLENKYLAG